LTTFEGIVAKIAEECCKETQDIKAFCLCVRACVRMCVCGCMCARKSERERMNERKEQCQKMRLKIKSTVAA
jgi:hypothetical protein